MNLSDLYDGDQRRRDPRVARMAATVHIPHPLHQIQYADGALECTHARACAHLITGSRSREITQ